MVNKIEMEKTNKNYRWSLRKRIIHHLMLISPFLNDMGLFYGKMGISIAFYLLGKKEQNNVYIEFGDDLLEQIFKTLSQNSSLDFDSGLCGIGWGIEYLIQNQFVEGQSLDVCKQIDQRIVQLDPRRIDNFTLEKGIYGLLHYVLIHLKGCHSQKSNCPFDSMYLNDLYVKIKFLKTDNKNLSYLQSMYVNYIEKNISPNYSTDVTFFKDKKLRLKSDQLLSYPLGIKSGLAGTLL